MSAWVLSGATGVLLGAGLFLHAFAYPGDEALRSPIQRLLEKSADQRDKLKEILANENRMRAEWRKVRLRLDRIQQAYSMLRAEAERQRRAAEAEAARQSQLHASQQRMETLFALNWRAMRSVEFEQYLEQVFQAKGVTVVGTKTTGDQGVDLVVQQGPWRIAVQVKGYFNSVGNGAVQEAYTGMAHYRCNACMVITNSRFTASAVELARSVGCHLIDEDAMHAFVVGDLLETTFPAGKIELGQA